MYYSDDIVEEVRQRNDIVSVISGYVRLQRRGSSYVGLCPFHNEKTPSFSVNPSKQIYHCFGCGAGGGVFNFIMEYENYTFPEAVRFLAERVGMSLPEEEDSGEARRKADLKNSLLQINKIAANFYYYQLRTSSGQRGLDYLRKRGITDQTLKHFGLGYAGTDGTMLYRYLKNREISENFRISDQLLRETGLMQVNEREGMYDRFWNRVIFPIMDVHNRVIGFGGRVLGDGKPKYLNSPETPVFDKSRNLYGLNFARSSKSKSLLLCEGYMDVISLHQAGFTNAVASLGTSLTERHASILKRYTDDVVLTYDSDDAGIKAAMRAISILKEAGVSVRVLHMDPYKDPDEFIKEKGAEAFQERIDAAEDSFSFELSVTEKSYDMKNPDSKTKFFQEVAARIAGFELEIERENYIEATVERYHISFDGMRKMVTNALMSGSPRAHTAPPAPIERNTEKDDGIKKAQRLILNWLAGDQSLYPEISGFISPDDFTDPLYHEVAVMLYDQAEKGSMNPARIIDHFTETGQQRSVSNIFSTDLPVSSDAEFEKALLDTIRQVKLNAVKCRRDELDPADLKGLQESIMEENNFKRHIANFKLVK